MHTRINEYKSSITLTSGKRFSRDNFGWKTCEYKNQSVSFALNVERKEQHIGCWIF